MDSNGENTSTRHLNFHRGAMQRSSRHKRSCRVIMTNAARVLKEIREERKQKLGSHNYSMRAISKRLSRSNAWLSHIENGRSDVPNDHRLDALLDIYDLKRKSFTERVRLYKQKVTSRSELHELIDRMDDENVRLVLVFAKSIVENI